jgi:hypothetical protein
MPARERLHQFVNGLQEDEAGEARRQSSGAEAEIDAGDDVDQAELRDRLAALRRRDG